MPNTEGLVKAKSYPLSLSLDSYRSICDQMPAMVAVYNIQTGQYLYVNKAIKKLLGYSPDDFIKGGLSFVASLVHPDDLPKIMSRNEKALIEANEHPEADITDETIVTFEYRIRHKKGYYIWLHTDGSVFSRSRGNVECVLNTSLDISSHKMTLQKLSEAEIKKEIQVQLKESEERYQAFIRNSREGIWRAELEEPIPINLPIKKQIRLMYDRGYLAEANQAMAEMYGLKSVDQLIGARIKDLLVESDPNNKAYLESFIKSGYNLSSAVSHEIDSKGQDKYFSNSLVGFIEENQLVRAWGTQVDITQQRQAADALRKSEERLARALHASKLGLWEWDVKTGELLWSDQQKKIFGLKKSDTVTYEDYLSRLHPDDLLVMKEIIMTGLKSGRSYQIEHRAVWPDGSIHWVLGQGQAVFEKGKPVRMVGTSLNIDDRKKTAELEAKNERLLAERELLLELNTAKDEFISIASHQLRTPATGVKQYLGMLLQGHTGKLQLSREQFEMLRIAYESNERQLNIVGDLLKTAQVDAGKISLIKKPTNIVYTVKKVLDNLTKELETKRQTAIFKSSNGSIKTSVDRERLYMAVENIIDNASKYSPEGSLIIVKVNQSLKNVLIHISDNGVGIAPEDQKKLFQKFSRIENPLSATVGGNGLGLYWVKKIITQHGGNITVQSEVNKGSTFTIRLPKKM